MHTHYLLDLPLWAWLLFWPAVIVLSGLAWPRVLRALQWLAWLPIEAVAAFGWWLSRRLR
jgi:hypothetical protein